MISQKMAGSTAQVPPLRAPPAAPSGKGRSPCPHGALDAGRQQLGQAMAGPQETHAVPSPGRSAGGVGAMTHREIWKLYIYIYMYIHLYIYIYVYTWSRRNERQESVTHCCFGMSWVRLCEENVRDFMDAWSFCVAEFPGTQKGKKCKVPHVRSSSFPESCGPDFQDLHIFVAPFKL